MVVSLITTMVSALIVTLAMEGRNDVLLPERLSVPDLRHCDFWSHNWPC